MSSNPPPRPIAWEEFTKAELVELLREFEQSGFTVEELWTNCNVHSVADCTCAPIERDLPPRVIAVRDRAMQRSRKPKSRTPLTQILSAFLSNRSEAKKQLPTRDSRLG